MTSEAATREQPGGQSGPEARGPAPDPVPDERHATSWLWEPEPSEAGGRHAVRFATDPDGARWDGWTRADLAGRVRRVAAGLVAAGVGPGDRVAIMSPTRVEWTVADLAILAAGAVTVPVYPTSSEDQTEWILSDAGAVLAFAADDELAARIRAAEVEGGREVVTFDDGGLDALAARGGDHDEDEVDRRLAARRATDLATIVYTSGTTGRPKGCRITHGNITWTVRQVRTALDELLRGEQSTLLFLPLAHIFARVIQFVGLEHGVQIAYARSLDAMRDDLRATRPTFLLAVPRVFQKVFDSARQQAQGLRRPVFEFAVRSATAWSASGDPGPWLRIRHRIADALVYAKLRDAVGGRVRFCVAGGAPLSEDLARFFHAAGITILEGYGLTETTAPLAVNTPGELRFGTVGRPLPGVTIRLADDGEVLVRGGNVFAGYHDNEEATQEAFRDGWYATGDIGKLDDGFLRIIDRKKELVVTETGENVPPSVLEERLTAHPAVASAMVVGDDRPFIGALVTLDEDGVPEGAGPDDEATRTEVQRAVDHANEAVSRAESIREFVILPRDFREDEDELTPTLKLRRETIAEHFAEEIESIYSR